ncbi:MAG: penicillin-binding protein activator LpoB [Balneola sp.]|nr:penicillin-binding protein activator LpoB [Balneola sp.]MBO6651152.1 penicillin-binding protein activator LpoB [Balneola sp.]MBO6710341.1 penicillin-binding protein activator LpoB [Balneola sp.]MBO6799026.1 penicillin-binding protein activator LpoB [Balneola sp.]MBO6870140.1 penicillin-binding protein activator LpoB [Balneola sp.]
MKYSLLTGLLLAFVLVGCRPSQKVTRINPSTTTDLSGKWNDTDARLVAEKMITDALSKPWLNQFNRNNQKPPVVIVGRVRNESMEHIDTEVFTKELERSFVNSGEISVVASSEERQDVREERLDQQANASYETTKKLGQELGADFMLIGNINSIVDEAVDSRTLAVFYTINLEFVNIQTNQKVWIGNEKIKKFIERRNYRGMP